MDGPRIVVIPISSPPRSILREAVLSSLSSSSPHFYFTSFIYLHPNFYPSSRFFSSSSIIFVLSFHPFFHVSHSRCPSIRQFSSTFAPSLSPFHEFARSVITDIFSHATSLSRKMEDVSIHRLTGPVDFVCSQRPVPG